MQNYTNFVEKKISLLKVICLAIIFYSTPILILSFFGLYAHHNPIHASVLFIYTAIGLFSFLMLRKFPKRYDAIVKLLLFTSMVTFSSALVFNDFNEFRTIWFYFIIFVSFFVANKKVGFTIAGMAIAILFAYHFSPYSTISKAAFMSTIMGFIIMTHLSHYFSSIMESNDQRLIDYQENLELRVKETVEEVEHLDKEMIHTQEEIIYTMGAIGESRSSETGKHVQRVAEYSYILAKLYGLSEEQAMVLKMASPMHDIGKVGIPDAILQKPAQLSDDEFTTMKTHASLGYEMLKHSKRDILKAAAIVAHEHHERWDGTGYPNGIKGKDIHIFGRITALADVFDALASERCYKKAWNIGKVYEYIIEKKGSQFDPELVSLFMDNLEHFIVIKDNYKD